jgi:hypothetical protein
VARRVGRGQREEKKRIGRQRRRVSLPPFLVWEPTGGRISLTLPKKGKHAPRMFLKRDWAAWAEDYRCQPTIERNRKVRKAVKYKSGVGSELTEYLS